MIKMSKRKRDPTFTTAERVALLKVVENHFSVVESKKTDAETTKNKIREWKKMSIEFNAISRLYLREWQVLKNCWENLKKRAKHERTVRNQFFLQAGGPIKKRDEDPVTQMVLNLLDKRAELWNNYDSYGTQVVSDIPIEQIKTQLDASPESSEDEADGSNEGTSPMTCVDLMGVADDTPNMLWESIDPLVPPQSPEPNVPIERPTITTIPKRAHCTAKSRLLTTSGRRRPMLHNKDMVTNEKNTLIKREHRLNMAILRKRLKREEQLLIQEKLKTQQEEIKLKILEYELNKLKK